MSQPPIVAILGLAGSFSDQAARKIFSEQFLPLRVLSFSDLFLKVTNSEADYGVIPIENSIAGAVVEVVELLKQHPVKIISEFEIPIQLSLFGLTDDLSKIQQVFSHPKALEQCSNFFYLNPDLIADAVSDTSTAASLVKKEEQAAICSLEAARSCGLTGIKADIQNCPDNKTRFLKICRIL